MTEFVERNEKVDCVMVDPPRKGCSTEFLERLTTLSPERIVYISCNVATQARDLTYLVEKGYKPLDVQPVDMFPHTPHIENEEFVEALKDLNERGIDFIISYDGMTGDKKIGNDLPESLDLIHLYIDAGTSAQSVLNGKRLQLMNRSI